MRVGGFIIAAELGYDSKSSAFNFQVMILHFVQYGFDDSPNVGFD
jgi:hypothetical protein